MDVYNSNEGGNSSITQNTTVFAIPIFWEICFFVPPPLLPCAGNLTILPFDFQGYLCFINPLFVASAVGGLKDSNVCAKAPTNSTSHSLKPRWNHIFQFHYSQLTTWRV